MLTHFFEVFLYLTLQYGITCASGVPVFLWGTKSPLRPTLSTISQLEFADWVEPLLAQKAVVAFLEPELTSKDFTCRSVVTGESCYPHLKSVSPNSYYANVRNPIDALAATARKTNIRSLSSVGDLESLISCEPGTLTIVSLNHSVAERSTALESHDALIAKVDQELNCPVIYLYTSVINSAETHLRRAPREAAPTKPVPLQDPLFVVYCEKLELKDSKGTFDIPMSSISVKSLGNEIQITLNEAILTIFVSGGYYLVREANVRGIRYLTPDIEFPVTFSYFCGKLVLTNGTNQITWHHLQLQGLTGKEEEGAKFRFHEAWDCVGFTTPAIISGLFVMSLIISITFCGVTWIMDISANSNFEDPDKDPIKISAED